MDLNRDHPCEKKQLAVAKEGGQWHHFPLAVTQRQSQRVGNLQGARGQMSSMPYLETAGCERWLNWCTVLLEVCVTSVLGAFVSEKQTEPTRTVLFSSRWYKLCVVEATVSLGCVFLPWHPA